MPEPKKKKSKLGVSEDRGTRPTPRQLKKLRGATSGDSSKADRDRETNPHQHLVESIQPSDLEPPDYLPEEAKQEWYRLAVGLNASGRLCDDDKSLFASYCSMFAEILLLNTLLENQGLEVSVTDKNGQTSYKPNPFLRERREAIKLHMTLSAQFGLSPSSRSRISVPTDNEEKDPLLLLMQQGTRQQKQGRGRPQLPPDHPKPVKTLDQVAKEQK